LVGGWQFATGCGHVRPFAGGLINISKFEDRCGTSALYKLLALVEILFELKLILFLQEFYIKLYHLIDIVPELCFVSSVLDVQGLDIVEFIEFYLCVQDLIFQGHSSH
jgi:hypothetical protein